MLFNPFWEKLYQNPERFFSVISRGVPLPHSIALQYYVKHKKCKVNDVIFPPGCEARTINLGNKNRKVGIFTGGTSVRSKNIFTDISWYPTGKHEIKSGYYGFMVTWWVAWYLTSRRWVNPFPNKLWFLHVCSKCLLQPLWEKEKLLVTSNFSFSHSVFYPFGELSTIFIKLKIIVCKVFELGRA